MIGSMAARTSFLSLAAASLLLAGCSPIGMATGAGATLGIASAQEGGIKGAAQDLKIRAQINDLWFRYDLETFAKLNITVDQGRVLLTGVVQDPEDRVEAVRLAWQADGVKQVINEIKIAEGEGLPGFLSDKWISTRLRTAMTFDSEIQSINYTVDTVQGVIYLMGVAHSGDELNRVLDKARRIPNVRQVVSYVKMAGEAVSAPQPGTLPPPAPAAPGAMAAPTSVIPPAAPLPAGAVESEVLPPP